MQLSALLRSSFCLRTVKWYVPRIPRSFSCHIHSPPTSIFSTIISTFPHICSTLFCLTIHSMSDSASRLFEPLPDLELAPLFCAKALESPEKRDESSKSSSSITTLIKGAFKDARKDIKSIPRPFSSSSRRFLARFGIVIWFASLFTLLSFLSFWMSLGLESPCEADGDFNIELDSEMGGFKYRGDLWAIKGFFEVTLGWGKLSFTAAKLIDVTWDLVRPMQRSYNCCF